MTDLDPYPAHRQADEPPRARPVIIYGRHSRSWMTALAPAAPVWRQVPGAGAVTIADEGDVASLPDDPDAVIIPLMERHILGYPRRFRALSPDREALATLADKGLFADYVRLNDLDDLCPRTFAGTDIAFPCVVKRCDLNAGAGIAVAETPDQMEELLARAPWHGYRYVLQEFIPSSFDYVTHAVYRDGRLLAQCSYRYRVRSENPIRGTGNAFPIERTTIAADTLDALSRLVAPLKYSGPLNFDYRFAGDGSIRVLEVNPRLGGSLMNPENADDLAHLLSAIVEHAH
jgi:predicted ATP-grasp superfamily ATP-dependent carboligase